METTTNDSTEYANSIFEQPWWLDIVAQGKWRDIVVEENGKVKARWPIVEKSNSIVMPEMTKTLGFWSSEKIQDDLSYYDKRDKLFNCLLIQMPKNKKINVCLDPKINYFLPVYWEHFTIIPRIIYRLEELTDIEMIFTNFSKTVKNNILRSTKKVIIKSIDNIDLLFNVVEETFRRKGTKSPYSRDLIKKIYNVCKVKNACKLLYAVGPQEEVYAGLFLVYDKNACHALVGGTNPKFRTSGAFSLLIWEGIKFASGVSKIFDFGGSMVKSIEYFLRQFGGKPVIYYQIKRSKNYVYFEIYYKILHYLKDIYKKYHIRK